MSNQPSHDVTHLEGSFGVSFKRFAELSTERDVFEVSPTLACLGREWEVSIYPGGTEESRDGIVEVGIANMSSQSIQIIFSFGVRNSAGREIVSHDEYDDEPTLMAACGEEGDDLAIVDLVSRSELLGALTDGVLVIEVKLRLADPVGMPPRPFHIENPFCKNMKKMFLDKASADVMLEVEIGKDEANARQAAKKKARKQKIFHAHLFIIKEGAPMLYELCKSGGRIRLNGINSSVFHHLLSYLYGKELSNETLAENAKEFINAADRYGAVHLKLRAEAEYAKTAISFDNVMDNLLYADSKNCALLKEVVMDFLVENKHDAIKKISFIDAPGYLMKDLLTAVAAKEGKKEEDGNNAHDYSTMRVDTLRRKLHEKGLDIDGSREAMIALLTEKS